MDLIFSATLKGREIHEDDETYQLKESQTHYGLDEGNIENTHLWKR